MTGDIWYIAIRKPNGDIVETIVPKDGFCITDPDHLTENFVKKFLNVSADPEITNPFLIIRNAAGIESSINYGDWIPLGHGENGEPSYVSAGKRGIAYEDKNNHAFMIVIDFNLTDKELFKKSLNIHCENFNSVFT